MRGGRPRSGPPTAAGCGRPRGVGRDVADGLRVVVPVGVVGRPGLGGDVLAGKAQRRVGVGVPVPGRQEGDREVFRHESGTRQVITAHNNKVQISDLDLEHGAGDENRTRALSLGSDGACTDFMALTCADACSMGRPASRIAPLLTVVARSYGHAMGTGAIAGGQSTCAGGHRVRLRPVVDPVGEHLRVCTDSRPKLVGHRRVSSRCFHGTRRLTSWFTYRVLARTTGAPGL
jgi:hypothetical protein